MKVLHQYKLCVKLSAGTSRSQEPHHGVLVNAPYQPKDHVQIKRHLASQSGTTYVYDWPALFRQVLGHMWSQGASECPLDPLVCHELVLDDSGSLSEQVRLHGSNEIGMVAWKMSMQTEEYPQGRPVIVIANDMTHKIGSFGPREDLLFKKASELARNLGCPRIYISANSGARIGLAEEIKNLFKVSTCKSIRSKFIDFNFRICNLLYLIYILIVKRCF